MDPRTKTIIFLIATVNIQGLSSGLPQAICPFLNQKAGTVSPGSQGKKVEKIVVPKRC
jgi:hypothetical protein